jgi:GntR family transcriptional regulator
MSVDWREDVPIYRQIKDKVVAAILDGAIREGEAIPSVRALAVELQVNPLTVSKAYQELADDGIVERRRGLGMFVPDGLRARLGNSERDQFLSQEWPLIAARIRRLGIEPADLVQSLSKGNEA